MGFSPGVAAPEWCLQAPGKVPLKNERRLRQGWLWSGFPSQERLKQWMFHDGGWLCGWWQDLMRVD